MNRLAILTLGTLLCTSLQASSITFKLSGIATGTLGATDFTNATFEIDSAGDTDMVAFIPPVPPFGGAQYLLNPLTSTTLSIQSIGSAILTDNLQEFATQSSLVFGPFGGLGTSTGVVLLAIENGSFNGYALASSIGPLSGGSVLNAGTGFNTSSGTLVIRSFSGTFQATVGSAAAPEPGSMALMSLAGLTFLAFRQRNRR